MSSALETARTLVVSEVFGPTFQGEGPSSGCRCSFVRLGGCNLSCRWCDTAYTWDSRRYDLREELSRTGVDAITGQIRQHGTRMVVVTGGEPLLHQSQPGWRDLLDWLSTYRYRVEVETNGTIAPDAYTAAKVTQFNVSPKLANSGDAAERRTRPDAIRALILTDKAQFKFVVRTPADVDEVAAVVAAHDLNRDRVWIMPEGTSQEVLLPVMKAVAPRALAHGFNITPRLHVAMHGNERGR